MSDEIAFTQDLEKRVVKNSTKWIKEVEEYRIRNNLLRDRKEHTFLKMALALAEAGTCLRRRHGAIIVDKDNRFVGGGYCGAPKGLVDCLEIGYCLREEMGIPSGQRYEVCRSVHAEENALLFAQDIKVKGATLYLVGIDAKGELYDAKPCCLCARTILQKGITRVLCARKQETTEEMFEEYSSDYFKELIEMGHHFPDDAKGSKFREYQQRVAEVRQSPKYTKED